MSQLYFPKTICQRFKCIATIVVLTICGLAFIFLSVFLIKDKINRDKQTAVQLVDDSINNAVIERTQKWIVDSVYQKGDYFYTTAHNLELSKLGIKIEDSIKPTYSIEDTIKF